MAKENTEREIQRKATRKSPPCLQGDAPEGLGVGTPTMQHPKCLQKELTARHMVQRDGLSASVASGNI